MNKKEIQAYFDRCAPEWDARMVRAQEKIDFILDAAGAREGARVLDVACGTGVLFEDYLRRGAKGIVGVDISPEMVRAARRKYPQSHISLICADIEEANIEGLFDCCVVYNALAHFPDPGRLIARLARFVAPGGRLCVAHSMGREALVRHHAERAENVSRPIPEVGALTALFGPYFTFDTAVDDARMYVAAGSRK
ncbi:MAG TPA: class I SAM-dependent methyltransferase [Clostridia bacterium]|nr:class I SAM-dependent methyltransferase [Clostridia bacterium]